MSDTKRKRRDKQVLIARGEKRQSRICAKRGGGILINIDACILAKFNCMVFGELLAASPHALQSYLQSDFEGKVSHYLKKELLRLYDKEKTWRERLWRNGITSSSPMAPRKQPKYVGIEEVFS